MTLADLLAAPTPFEGFPTNASLFVYCDTHSETERALFSGAQINYLRELAGWEPLMLADTQFMRMDSEDWNTVYRAIKEHHDARP